MYMEGANFFPHIYSHLSKCKGSGNIQFSAALQCLEAVGGWRGRHLTWRSSWSVSSASNGEEVEEGKIRHVFGTLFRGNWIGEAPYRNGRSCSECPPSYGGGCLSNLCYKGMCKQLASVLLYFCTQPCSTQRTACTPQKKAGALLWSCNTPRLNLQTITCCGRLLSVCYSFTLHLKCIWPHLSPPVETAGGRRQMGQKPSYSSFPYLIVAHQGPQGAHTTTRGLQSCCHALVPGVLR